jgi:hypothetical protein
MSISTHTNTNTTISKERERVKWKREMESTGWMDETVCCHDDPPLHVLYISLYRKKKYNKLKKKRVSGGVECNTCAKPLLLLSLSLSVYVRRIGSTTSRSRREMKKEKEKKERKRTLYATVMRQSRNCDTRERDDGLERKACCTIHTVEE